MDPSGNETKVYFSPDRTAKQREIHRTLVATLKQRRNNGESGLVIRNYKIVKIQPFRFKPEEYWE